jgi:vacuolar-type H+-ATPase subunit H
MNSYKQKKWEKDIREQFGYFENNQKSDVMPEVINFIQGLIDETEKEAQSEFGKILKEKQGHYELREKLIIEEIKKEIREWMNRQDFPDIAWKIKLENLLNKIK